MFSRARLITNFSKVQQRHSIIHFREITPRGYTEKQNSKINIKLSSKQFHTSKLVYHGGHSHSPFLEKNKQAKEACEKVTILGMWTNGLLMVGKGLAGFYCNSQALIADALHSFSDFASDLVTLHVVKKVRKPHTSKYPYG